MPGAFDPELTIPEHIAVIMDGNGRWAKSRGKARNEGHREGAKSVEAILEAGGDIGVKYLTLYAFSSENWKRPRSEVDGLMGLLTHFLKAKTSSLIQNNIRLRVIGAIEMLPESSRKQLQKTIDATAANDGLTLYVALSYGSREEIVRAARTLMDKSARGEMNSGELTVENFGQFLYTADCPDPRSFNPDKWRVSNLEFPTLADQLLGNLYYRCLLARLPPPSFGGGDRGLPETAPAIWRSVNFPVRHWTPNI